MSSSCNKDENQCYTYFRIVGNFDPDEISLKLGLHPYDSWKAEDKNKFGREYVLASYTNRKKLNEIFKNFKAENKAHAEI